MTALQSDSGQFAVLIVDDRDTSRKQLARWLRRTGEFRVDTASSGEDAIELVKLARGNFDAVVMDQELGGMSGIETMKRLRVSYPTLQVLMFTGEAPEAGVEALRQGAYRYILKGRSFQSDELVLTIRAMAEARRQHVRARETHWLQALLRIAQSATFLTLNQLFMEVPSSARDILGGATSILWISDQKSNQLTVAGWSGNIKEQCRETLRLDLGAAPTKRFIQERQPIYLSDVTDPTKARFYTKEHRKVAREHGWVSLLSAPMVAEQKVVGILDVYTSVKRAFSPEDRDLLQALAEQAALAVQRAMVEQERSLMLERLRKVSTLSVSGGILESPGKGSNLKSVLEQIAQGAGELAGADFVVIYPYDFDKDLFYDLESVVTWGQKKPEWSPKGKPRQRGLAAVIRNLGELVICDTKNNIICPHSEREIETSGLGRLHVLERIQEARFIVREDIRAFVGLSLRASQSDGTLKEVGIMYIDFREPRQFTEEQLNIIRIFGNQAGSAIQSVQLLENERFQRRQAETLQKAAGTISANLEMRQAARSFLGHLGEFIEYKKATVQLMEGDTRRLLARRGFQRVDKRLLRSLSEDPLASRIAKEQKPTVFSDLSDPSIYPEWEVRPGTENVKSWIGLPLVFGNETVGLITLDHTTPGFYTEVYLDQLIAFADQAAIAIYNARIHETLKQLVTGGQALAKASLSLRGTLKTVAKTAKIVMRCDIAIVHPIDERSNELRLDLATMVGAKDAHSKTKKPRISGNTQRILDEGRLIVEDTADTERYPFLNPSPESFLNRVRVRSFLGIRMQVGEQSKGVLYFDYQLPRRFTADELEVAQLLANQAAIAIDNAQRYEQRIRDTQMLAALQEVNSAITISSLVNVAALIAKKAKQLAHANFGAVWSLDQDKQHLEVLAYSGPSPRSMVVPVNDSINGHVVTTREPIVINNLREDARFRKEYHDFMSCMAVPLKIEGQITGTLYIKAKQQDAFSEQDLVLLEALADQASIAIRNAEVFEQRRQDIQALQEINEAVVSESVEDVLQLVVDKALDVLPGEHSALWLLEAETGDLILASEGGTQLVASETGGRLKKDHSSINMQVARSGVAHITKDAASEGAFFRIYQAAQSAVTVPLKYRAVVIGTLNVESSQKSAYTGEHQDLLDAFGDQAAIAIKNARLFTSLDAANAMLEDRVSERTEQLARRVSELEAISDLQRQISQLVPSEEQMDLIYEATAKTMAGLMDIRNMYIAIYNWRTDEVEFALKYEDGIPVQREKSYLQRRKRGERRGLTDWVIDHKQSLLVADDFKAETLALGIQPFEDPPTLCWLGAPMMLGGEVIGVIGLNHFDRANAYDESHRDLLMTIAGQAAVAIENARQYERVQHLLRRRSQELLAVGRFQQNIVEIDAGVK